MSDSVVIIRNYGGAEAVLGTSRNSFMCTSIQPLLPGTKIIEIISLRSNNEKQGDATRLLADIVEEFKDYAILLKAEPMFDTVEEYDACLNRTERLDRLIKFYGKRGFASINNIVGYSCGEAMCFKNHAYTTLSEIASTLE